MGCLTHNRWAPGGRSSPQEFSWADSLPYGIPISVGFLYNTPEIVIFRHFGLAMTFVACATQPQIEVLFLDFWRF